MVQKLNTYHNVMKIIIFNWLSNDSVPSIMLSTFHVFLGYSSEQSSEIDTVMIHILQTGELKQER